MFRKPSQIKTPLQKSVGSELSGVSCGLAPGVANKVLQLTAPEGLQLSFGVRHQEETRMEITILVKSSSRDEPYAVAVLSKESWLSIFCDCPAGEWGKYCKHKMAIVLADKKILYDEEQIDNFNKVTEWISVSGYPDLAQELRESERELEAAKKKIKHKKEKIAHLMKEGLK